MTNYKALFLTVVLGLFVGVLFVPVSVRADTIAQQLQVGKELLQQKNFQGAAERFHQLVTKQKAALEKHPQHAEVWENFGLALDHLGKKEQATKAMQRAADLRAAIQAQRTRSGASEPAPVPTEQASGDAAPPATPAATGTTETTTAGTTGTTGTIAVADAEGIGQQPEDPEVAQARKKLYAAKPDFAGAETILQGILANHPQHCQALTAFGEMYLLRGDYDRAQQKFTEARQANAGDVRPLMGLGNTYLAKAVPEKAIDEFRLAWEIEPRFYEAQAKLAKALIAADRTQEGSHLLHQAIAKDPENLEARLELVALQLANNNDMSASEHLEKCLETTPQDPRVLFYQGIWLEMRKLLPDAMKNLRLAANSGGEFGIKAKIYLADIHTGIGHAFPGNPFSNTNQESQEYYKLFSNPEKALHLYQEALAINPNHPEATRVLAWIDANDDDLSAAQALSEQVQGRFRTR